MKSKPVFVAFVGRASAVENPTCVKAPSVGTIYKAMVELNVTVEELAAMGHVTVVSPLVSTVKVMSVVTEALKDASRSVLPLRPLKYARPETHVS